MMRLTLLALCLMNVFAAIKDCSKPNSLFKFNALGFWPDPAIKNENSTISFAYTNPGTTVTAGTAKYSYTYNFIPLTPTTADLCTQTTCPIAPGTYNQSSSSTFPDLTGQLVIKIEWFNAGGEILLCAQINTKV